MCNSVLELGIAGSGLDSLRSAGNLGDLEINARLRNSVDRTLVLILLDSRAMS